MIYIFSAIPSLPLISKEIHFVPLGIVISIHLCKLDAYWARVCFFMFAIGKCTSDTNLFYLHQLIFWKDATSFFRFQYHQILKIHRLCILYSGKKYFLNIGRKVFLYVQNVLSTYICLSFFNVSDTFWWSLCRNANLLKIFHRIS